MPELLKLVVYDATDTPSAHVRGAIAEGAAPRSVGLSPIWSAGTWMHKLRRAADATLGARSWEDALTWAVSVAETRKRSIASLQFWGHGAWGYMLIGQSRLDRGSLKEGHAMAPQLDRLREHLAGPDALIWLRCCSAFGSNRGKVFAESLAGRLGCRVAGHTYVIGFWQSGTHSLNPGENAMWGAQEGVRWKGDRAISALSSSANEPNTMTCLGLDLPVGW